MANTNPTMPKDPAASKVFGVDWVNDLPAGVTIASVAWTVPAGITKVADDIDGSQGLIQLSGGTLGETYTLVGTATLSDGQVLPHRIYITIANQ